MVLTDYFTHHISLYYIKHHTDTLTRSKTRFSMMLYLTCVYSGSFRVSFSSLFWFDGPQPHCFDSHSLLSTRWKSHSSPAVCAVTCQAPNVWQTKLAPGWWTQWSIEQQKNQRPEWRADRERILDSHWPAFNMNSTSCFRWIFPSSGERKINAVCSFTCVL